MGGAADAVMPPPPLMGGAADAAVLHMDVLVGRPDAAEKQTQCVLLGAGPHDKTNSYIAEVRSRCSITDRRHRYVTLTVMNELSAHHIHNVSKK